MALPAELLQPIEGDNPSGASLKWEPVYDTIREARREEEDLAQGAWEHERKLADWPAVIKLASSALTERSKDLQIAVWLAEAWVNTKGFAGLLDGLTLISKLNEAFWDTLYPEIVEDDDEPFADRVTPLNQLGGPTFAGALRAAPITDDGRSFVDHGESRAVGYEEGADSKEAKEARAKKIKEGKPAPEDFDKSFAETPKAHYVEWEKQLDESLAAVKALDEDGQKRCGDEFPSYSALRGSLEEVRHAVHLLLEKKRELEPDEVEEEGETEGEGEGENGEAGAATGGGGKRVGAGSIVIPPGGSEPPERKRLILAIAGAAEAMRKADPRSPAPYLMLRGLRWGELRDAARKNDASMLEAPATELRQHLKRLALDESWDELLETAEKTMALPCGRVWLDLQRYVIEACSALGKDYDAVSRSIRTELIALLHDVPDVLQLTMLDDTPAGNLETRIWLREMRDSAEDTLPAALRKTPAVAPPPPPPPPEPEPEPEPAAAAEEAEPGDGDKLADEASEKAPKPKAAKAAAKPKATPKKPAAPPPPPPPPAATTLPPRLKPLDVDYALHPGWRKKDSLDSYELALKTLRSGDRQKAFKILSEDIEKQGSGRGRFQRRLQLAELMIENGQEAIAQPILEDLAAAMENHKLAEWEDRSLVSHALLTIYKHCVKVRDDKKAAPEYFERICRLDPVRALEL